MPKDLTILRQSRDQRDLMKTAVDFAASDQAVDHSVLLEFLNSSSFLNRLDTEEEYLNSAPKQLHIARVVRTLMDNPAPVSKGTLLALARGGDFVSFEPRQELLVRALVAVRPSPPEAIKYWDSQSQPDSINLHLTIDALCDNGSEPAIGLLEKKLADPQQEFEYRVLWMRSSMLRHRNDLPLLRVCERMITSTLPPELRPLLVEALCDYHREWYLSCKPPKPPPRIEATPEAKEQLRKICQFARDNVQLTPGQRAAVESTLLEVGGSERAPRAG